MKHPRHHGRLPSRQALRFLRPEQIDELLQPLLPDPSQRAFVQRCLIDEGPLHHRGSNYLLLMLLQRLLQHLPDSPLPDPGEPVPMLLPPHLEGHIDESHYPLRLPTRLLAELVEHRSEDVRAAVDCLTDGPPQHALANVVMVSLLERLDRALTERA